MARPDCYLVEIELMRLQTFLFAVPRLGAMVGANTLVGETLRGLWYGTRFNQDDLPGLAKQCGAGCPVAIQSAGGPPALSTDGVPFVYEVPLSAGDKGQKDPLWKDAAWQDDVSTVAQKTGVLSRDGGHFEALFPAFDSESADEAKQRAESYMEQARQLLAARLPGVPLQVRLHKLEQKGGKYILPAHHGRSADTGINTLGVSLLELPQAHVCEDSGHGPASKVVGVEGADERRVSNSVKQRLDRGNCFDEGKTHDVLGILRPRVLQLLKVDSAGKNAFPADFQVLSRTGYLAVVHVDGNGVGARSKGGPESEKDFFAAWAYREQFFHALRIGMRQAVLKSIEVFEGKQSDKGQMPFRLLMLGGDDLVMVCDAPFALPFVERLAQHLRDTTKDLPDGKKGTSPLTIGAGVAITQATFPFYRAYELAEELTQSAKQLAASSDGDKNAVDWIVTSEAWHGNVRDTRRRDCIVDQTILTAKPYRILGDDKPSLEKLLKDATQLRAATREKRVARSQLQTLFRRLPDGYHTARFAAAVLPRDVRDALQGYLWEEDGIPSPWKTRSGERHVTEVADLMELYELEFLCHQHYSEKPAQAEQFELAATATEAHS